MDHIICRKKHGDDRKGNLNLTCSMCNRAKHDLPLIKLFEWFEHIQNTNISNLKKFSLLKEKQVLKSIKRNPFYILPSPERKAKERRKSYQRKLIIGLRNKIKRDQSIFI